MNKLFSQYTKINYSVGVRGDSDTKCIVLYDDIYVGSLYCVTKCEYCKCHNKLQQEVICSFNTGYRHSPPEKCKDCVSHRDNNTCKKMDGHIDPELGDLTGIAVEGDNYACDMFEVKK